MNPIYQDPGPCVCGHESCDAVGTKLNKEGHLTDCCCPVCTARYSSRKGRRGEVRRHAVLSRGKAPNDEYPNAYPLTVMTQDKVGEQIPKSFSDFVATEFYRHAMQQVERKVPIGADVHPALYLEPEGGGAWLLVDIAPKTKGPAR